MTIFHGRSTCRYERHARPRSRLSAMCSIFVSILLLAAPMGCDRAPTSADQSGPIHSVNVPGLVRLPPEQLTQSGVTVEPAGRTEFRTYRTFPGVVRPNENALANITTLVRGRVAEVHADLGQMVKANQLLAVLHSSDLGLAQSAYLKARARRHVAEQAYQRAKFLFQEKVIGQAEEQRREGEMISIRAEAQEAREGLRLLGMDDKEIGSLERTQTIRSQIPIVAPFSGRVIVRDLTKGELVDPTHKLFTVADLSTVWVLAEVPEKDIGFVQSRSDDLGSVEVQVSAYPKEFFHGEISYVGDVLEAATRTMRVRVKVPNPDGRLKPEMYATVRVVSKPDPDAITVPKSSVLEDHGESIVFVRLNEQEFGRRVVHIVGQNDKHVHVGDGLTEGEEVVVAGAYMLKSELARQQEGAISD
ncbi:MAG: efflux RND transporter periplasmic adaptor subunit [Nitrospirota bacterium]